MKRKTQLGKWVEVSLWMCGNCNTGNCVSEAKVLCNDLNEIKSVHDSCDYLEPLDFLKDGCDDGRLQ